MFEDSPPDPEAPWYIDSLLAKTEIALELGYGEIAARSATTAVETLGEGEDVPTLQLAYYLMGEAYDAIGDADAATEAYTTAHALAPQTEIGRLSAQ